MKIANSLELFKKTVEKSPIAILIVNVDKQEIIYHNQLAEEFFGQKLTHLIEKEAYVRLMLETKAEFQLTISSKGKDRVGAVSVRRMSWDRTSNKLRILYINDISDLNSHHEEPYLDELTGISRRNLFSRRIEEAITLASANKGAFGLLYLDLDGFKQVNDTFGHASGDKVLKIVTKRIKACIREGDSMGRLGGDEFGIIILDVQKPENVGAVAKKIIESLEQEIKIEKEKSCFISASVGVSMYPVDGVDHDALIQNADRAMYIIKQDKGKGGYAFYSDGIVEQYQNRKKLESAIRQAVQEPEQFVLHFMPQIDMATGRLSAVEALTYWRPPGQELKQPYEFIPVATQSNLIVSIEHIAFGKAGRHIFNWLEKVDTTPPFRLVVNLSSRHFATFESMEILNQMVEKIGLDPSFLDLEISESIMINDPKGLDILFKLKEKNVSLTLDNYGSQETSLLSLKRFPITAIKVDRIFVRNILKKSIDKAIVKNTINLANEIGLRTIAQGVESEEQLELLLGWGCDEVQGYLFSKPLPAEQFLSYMRTFQPSKLLSAPSSE